MNREQFAAATAGLGEAELRKALWTVYWRGTAAVRERIEEIIAGGAAGGGTGGKRRTAPQVPDPETVRQAAREFAELVRSGAYIAPNRAVRQKERSQWRFTFRRLVADARAALAADDPTPAEAALAELIDLACQLRDYEYVCSDDPVEAAAVVVSDEVAALWRSVLDRRGFAGFAAQAPEQLLRWESQYGWTRHGGGTIAERERGLAEVAAGLLTVPDTWARFAERYLEVLDGVAPPPATPSSRRNKAARAYEEEQQRYQLDYRLRRRTETMIDWHLILLDRFAGTEEEALLDRLAVHPALGGPEQAYFQARLAQVRGDVPAARRLVCQALEVLPGNQDFLALALEIDAELPPAASRLAASRRIPPP